jgi:hypothetical protein
MLLENKIGYIIFVCPSPQDCAVGLLFALLPILSGASGLLQGVASMAKSYVQCFNPSFVQKYTFMLQQQQQPSLLVLSKLG